MSPCVHIPLHFFIKIKLIWLFPIHEDCEMLSISYCSWFPFLPSFWWIGILLCTQIQKMQGRPGPQARVLPSGAPSPTLWSLLRCGLRFPHSLKTCKSHLILRACRTKSTWYRGLTSSDKFSVIVSVGMPIPLVIVCWDPSLPGKFPPNLEDPNSWHLSWGDRRCAGGNAFHFFLISLEPAN